MEIHTKYATVSQSHGEIDITLNTGTTNLASYDHLVEDADISVINGLLTIVGRKVDRVWVNREVFTNSIAETYEKVITERSRPFPWIGMEFRPYVVPGWYVHLNKRRFSLISTKYWSIIDIERRQKVYEGN